MVSEALRKQVMAQAQGALALNIAFIGVTDSLFDTLAKLGHATADELAGAAGVDAGYVQRWCDAAFAFGYLDGAEGAAAHFTLAEAGEAFRPETEGTLMPFAIQSMLGAHMAARIAELLPSGERPGEKALAEWASILPWFGPMLEANFAPFFEREILPNVPAYRALEARGGWVVDLGCGNGWYLRRLAAHYPNLRGIGLDGIETNIRQATERAKREGVADRLQFRCGDLHEFGSDEPVDLIAMNRALHHVWSDRERVFRLLRAHLRPGGTAVIWEPAWPATRAALRAPALRPLSFQNLSEHLLGNHFLEPEEVADAFREVGMAPEIYRFAEGREAVIVGTVPK